MAVTLCIALGIFITTLGLVCAYLRYGEHFRANGPGVPWAPRRKPFTPLKTETKSIKRFHAPRPSAGQTTDSDPRFSSLSNIDFVLFNDDHDEHWRDETV